jgi:hypothetical protein
MQVRIWIKVPGLYPSVINMQFLLFLYLAENLKIMSHDSLRGYNHPHKLYQKAGGPYPGHKTNHNPVLTYLHPCSQKIPGPKAPGIFLNF